ncbi:MAG: substrate-binding domain-containing protein [Eubacteriales bacterium]|nr:substrate-binding domain-containing protein [Eubacteriales bacterium]
MKKGVIIIFALMLLVSLLASCAESTTSQSTEASEGPEETGTTDTSSATETTIKWRVALSNSYVGNDWRQNMQKVATYVAGSDVWKDRVTLDIINCENTAEAQSASIDALILEEYDAILIDAASATALNPALQRALDAGIVVVSFDQVVEMDGVVKYGISYDKLAAELAKYLVEAIGGEGNIVVDRGLAGASGSVPLYDAAMAVFDQYPEIVVVAEFDSNFAEGDTLTGMQAALAANPKIDAVYTQGYVAPVIQALQEAGHEMVPIAGWNYNGSVMALAENDCDGVIACCGTGYGADALALAVQMLEGKDDYPTGATEKIEANWYLAVMDMDTAANANLSVNYEMIEEDVNWWSDMPPGFQPPDLLDIVGDIDIPNSLFTE